MVTTSVDVYVCVWGGGACVCIGNQESHLLQQIFPGDWWSRCAVITNMICACSEHWCTWLICCTTCLCGDSFVCFCRIIPPDSGEASRRARALKQEEMMFFFFFFLKAQVQSLTLLTTRSFGTWFSLDTGCTLCLFYKTTWLALPLCRPASAFCYCCWHDCFIKGTS